MRKYRTDMLNGVIWKEIFMFSLPIMFGSLFQQLYNTVDAMIVGNFVGTAALGAVGGSTGTFINLLVGFVVGLSSGATVVIAQSYGLGEANGVRKGVNAGMFLAGVFGVVMMFVGIFFAEDIMKILNVPSDIFSLAVIYLRTYMIGMIPTMLYNMGSGVLRAVGDSRRPLYYLIVACIVNIVLDIVFVGVLPWGVAGAAAATVISQIVSCILVMRDLAETDNMCRFSLREFSLDVNVLKTIIVIGLPIAVQSVLYSVSNLFIQAGVNQYGTATVAAYTAFGKIDAVFWNTSGALGTAILTFCGQNFGAGNYERVKKSIWITIGMYIAISLAIEAVCLSCGMFLFRLFTSDQEVISSGMGILNFICPLWFVFCFVEIISSACRGCGNTLVPTLITALGVGAFRIWWILFYPGQNIFDTLLCYPISWIATSILFILYHLFSGWMKRAIVHRERILGHTENEK
jgi:putative MATE family efflux protein